MTSLMQEPGAAITQLGPFEVHIWCLRTGTVQDDRIPGFGDTLSFEESESRDRIRRPDHKRDYVIAHDFLRRSLSRYSTVTPHEWRFVRAPHGKPQTTKGTPSFNLSHTRGVVACAIAQSMAVGIDVERTDRATDGGAIAERFFSPSEAAALRATHNDTQIRFVEIWTLKEAFIKAIGLGLSQPLDVFSFSLDGSMIRFTAPPECCSAEWQFVLYAPYPETRVAVAVHSPEGPVQWRARLHPEGLTIEPIGTSSG